MRSRQIDNAMIRRSLFTKLQWPLKGLRVHGTVIMVNFFKVLWSQAQECDSLSAFKIGKQSVKVTQMLEAQARVAHKFVGSLNLIAFWGGGQITPYDAKFRKSALVCTKLPLL